MNAPLPGAGIVRVEERGRRRREERRRGTGRMVVGRRLGVGECETVFEETLEMEKCARRGFL